jgi:hypothetical protein
VGTAGATVSSVSLLLRKRNLVVPSAAGLQGTVARDAAFKKSVNMLCSAHSRGRQGNYIKREKEPLPLARLI